MCGISGMINYNGEPVDHPVLKKMTDVLSHRGPDDEGFYINQPQVPIRNGKWYASEGIGNAGLGHRRLSIIDLSSGHQPMTNEDQTIWIVFNGEIYNFPDLKKALTVCGHRFRTNSDTEVIVHAYEEWGEHCVKRLRGMFAFAIWDQPNQLLFIARDRLGIKPLYYYSDDSKFLFGSEIKSILAHPGVTKRIRVESLVDYLCLMYIPAPVSIFENIYKLLPGHTLTVKNGKIALSEYWDLKFNENLQVSEAEWCDKIITKLRESVKIRLISDVPLGAFLSGGVDSSAVVAMMASVQKEPVKTSSIGFSEQAFNELPYARKIVDRYGTDHHEMIVTPDAADVLDKLVGYFDEPFADSSSIPTYYVSQVARQKVTVALSGDGGDENFAGYRRYYFDRLENRIRSYFPPSFRRQVIGTLAAIYPKADRLPQMFRAKTLLTNISLDPIDGYYNSMSWFQSVDQDILAPSLKKKLGEYRPCSWFREYYEKADTTDPLSKIQYMDIKTYLVDDILAKVDRASMAHALEVRVPVLDHEFMELVATIPSGLKLNGKDGKYIFKKALTPYVPSECMNRKKMGFSIPLARWLKNDLKPIFEKNVLSAESVSSAYLDMAKIRRLWYSHVEGRRDFAYELWAILFWEKWGRKWL